MGAVGAVDGVIVSTRQVADRPRPCQTQPSVLLHVREFEMGSQMEALREELVVPRAPRTELLTTTQLAALQTRLERVHAAQVATATYLCCVVTL